MSGERFKTDAFRAAVQEVVAAHLADKTHIPAPDKLVELVGEAALAAIEAAFGEDDFKPAKGLENIPFTEFAKLSVLVPRKNPPGLIDYPLLSANFLAEPIFKKFPTIGEFRAFLAANQVENIDHVTSIKTDGIDAKLRYDRRAELIQLIHRTGLDPLPGMVPFMGMGKGSAAFDTQYLQAFMEQATSPQTRDMVRHLISEGEGDNTYLYVQTPITRDLIRKHLKLGESDGMLDNAVAFRNTGAQVAAHLRFLLDFRHIGLRGGKPYLLPFQPKGRQSRLNMISKTL